jgi:phage repressor protein C with HTH and peptisase S24 domain
MVEYVAYSGTAPLENIMALKVTGNCMKADDILDGDTLLVNAKTPPLPGNIVVWRERGMCGKLEVGTNGDRCVVNGHGRHIVPGQDTIWPVIQQNRKLR